MITFVFVYLSPPQTKAAERKTGMEPLRHFNSRLLERLGPGFIHYRETSRTLPIIGNQMEK